MSFVTLTQLPIKSVLGGAVKGHYAHLDRMTIGEVRMDAGAVLPMHAHPHDQITYVISGRYEFTVGDETTVMEPGMTALIPGGVIHGGKTLTACHVIDLFAPVREDYR
jgi:quercetin dioxygenase-like cupin family protein